MNRLCILASAGLVALAGCTDEPTSPAAVAPDGLTPSLVTIAVTPSGPGNTPDNVAQTLGGPGVTIQNVTYTGTPASLGTYTNGATNVGFDGIVLSTGNAINARGPAAGKRNTNTNRPGDADVTAVAGVPTFDAAVLQFEIVPSSGDSAYFEYVFGSDEYPEFVGSPFADAFVLKVNGQNCAVVGDPPVPITINTINSGSNASLYRANSPATIDIAADGLTTVLTCRVAINAGVPNTVKLAIADGFDHSFDSWVFIKAGSFSTTPPPPPPGSNTDPVLASIANQAVNEGSAAGFTASATDADAGQTITYSLIGAPAGASIDPATGVFSWTPTDDDPTATPADDYTFTVRATDDADPAAYDEQSVTITVSNVAPTVTSVTGPAGPIGISGGSASASISAAFTDPGSGDTHTTSIACGNATSASGGNCTYTAAGVYTVTATVTDDDGGSDSGTYQYVVVYDPSAGFVTGGGWITSPAGAYAANPALTGRINFGFNSKYKKNASVPDGQTQFQFQVGNLNFHSTAYEWLVVTTATAQYEGTGTINGSGSYGFRVTVTDGQASGGGGVDRFRIRIWNLGTGTVIYDNQMGDAENAAASTALGGGSIVIHGN